MYLTVAAALASACIGDGAAYAGAAARPPAPAPAVLAAPALKVAAAIPAAAPAVPGAEEEASGLAFAEVSDAALVERVRAAIEGISTLKADFTQVAPSGATSTGRFYLRRPGDLRFEYDRPSPLLIVATGGAVFVRDEALDTTDSYPVGRTPLKYLLKKRVELEDAKIVSVDRGVDSVAVTFAPTKDETEGELSIIMSAPALDLKEWIVRDPQNGVTFVTLANLERDGDLPGRLFVAPKTGSAILKD
jgi:outer membrane lipoprotein-sorting protein